MQSAPLFYKDGDQTRQCHHQHGDESGKLAQHNGEADKADKRHTDCPSSQCQETPSDAHKLQRLLQSLEYRIAFVIHRHTVYFLSGLFEKQRQCLGQCDKSNTASNGQHDSLFYVLVAVLHFKINVKSSY